MRTNTIAKLLILMVAHAIGTASAWAANEPDDEARYAGQLEELRAELTEAVPTLKERKQADYLEAHGAEKAAKADIVAAQQRLGEVQTAAALVAHAKGKWIGGADRGIAQANAQLEAATTSAEREAAQAELVKWEQNRVDGVAALEERQAALDAAEQQKPGYERDLADAQKALVRAQAQTVKAIKGLKVNRLLSSDELDARLAKYVVLLEATPRGLAAFTQQGEAQRKLVDDMLADEDLLVQMAVADGARDGKYGQTMGIYRAILDASPRAHAGALQRLALAIGLEHAVPRPQRNALSRTDAPATVDPVARYLHFETAFLAGELDPGFETLTVWDYRMVVDGEEPDEVLTWGREMLRSYRPDHISTKDYGWRYVAAVRTDIRYGSQDNQYDRDDLQFFQNILMNGGVCGRRAFFGRFILRAFGVPTTARPQRGHAALAHWTPDGWVVCLGGGWGSGWTSTRYDRDLDFLATTQARATGEEFLQIKRAQWIGDVLGEKRTFGLLSGEPAFWNGLALYRQRSIIEEAETRTLAAVGEDIGEANETKEPVDIAEVSLTDADRTAVVDESGVITIPASATSKPLQSTGKIIFMDSNLGGRQLHYSRNGGHQEFEYTFDAPVEGRYALTARVVTPSWKQSLLLAVNDAAHPVEMLLPFTVGTWESTRPIEIKLVKGTNVLRFSRQGEVKGVTIKDFTLTPVRASQEHR
ncbi:MAG: hypothetical protein O2816_07500 [Planctomycetota bacterium]|nr:hypothetical protein [Planctomycetota bacterium]